MRMTPQELKESYSPEMYYARYLNGDFGKGSRNGWYVWNGLCPFHDDKNAGSLTINKLSGAYHCFACDAKGGDIMDFHQEKFKTSFQETKKQLMEDVQCVK